MKKPGSPRTREQPKGGLESGEEVLAQEVEASAGELEDLLAPTEDEAGDDKAEDAAAEVEEAEAEEGEAEEAVPRRVPPDP